MILRHTWSKIFIILRSKSVLNFWISGTSSQPGASACRATSGTGTGINAGNGFNNGFRPGLGGFNGYPGLGGFNGYGGYGGFNGFNPFFG